jgi:cyclopropane-fatty-acyl-phospholipid synthase
VVTAMEAVDLEVRDVESLREHYPVTLRRWIDNLDAHWEEAVALVGAVRAKVWRLYLLGAIITFELNQISVHQVLGVKTGADGRSGMPATRAGMI